MLEIDGAYGEGGGQLVRTAVALAAVTGFGLRLRNIRANRVPSGLAPQHSAAIRAVAMLCGARIQGVAVGSSELQFHPNRLRGGSFQFEVGTAGSVTLVLQAVLPVAIACPEPINMTVRGGTDIRAAPPLDYFAHVFLPLLRRIGVQVTLQVNRRGYYPRGGGEISLKVQPGFPRALKAHQTSAVEAIGGIVHTAGLPSHVLERMHATATRAFAQFERVAIEAQSLTPEQAVGQGGATVLWARIPNSVLGGAEVAQRGIPAEHVAQSAADALRAEIDAGVSVDIHAADQLLVYLAFAREPSCFTVRQLTSHAKTTQWLLQQFLPVRFKTSAVGACTRLEVLPPASHDNGRA